MFGKKKPLVTTRPVKRFTCPTCKGSGRLREWFTQGGKSRPKDIDCYDCGGCGYLGR